MIAAQLNTLCAGYQNVDRMSIHTASGTDTSNMIGSKQTLTWGSPSSGVMTSSATFSAVTATVKYVRVWDDTVFIDEFPVNVGVGVEVFDQDVTVAIQHRVKT